MSTNYYILKPAVDTPETGNAYPAAEIYDDYDFNAPNSVHKLNYRAFPNFEPDIRFKLAKGAKLTDMISQAAISGHGFLINEKLKTVFEEANLVPHHFYPATIENEGVSNKYYWMHFIWMESNDFIDFTQSKFFIRKFSSKLEDIKISSYEEYLSEKERIGTLKTIDFTKLNIKSVPYDIYFTSFRGEIFATDRLKQLIESKNPTGVEFQIYDKLNLI